MKLIFYKINAVATMDKVFLYETYDCNASCLHCYMKNVEGQEIGCDGLVKTIFHFRKRKAEVLSLLGGEPTTKPFSGTIATIAKQMGYRFVRLCTNGMWSPRILEELSDVDALYFSIDGPTPASNDFLRRGCRLQTALSNMKKAIDIGYDVRWNSTVTSLLDVQQVFELIELAEKFGASEINLNPMLLIGGAAARYELGLDPKKWYTYYSAIRNSTNFGIRIKIPEAVLRLKDLRDNANGSQCVIQRSSRVYIMPNGDCYPCLSSMGLIRYRVGRFCQEGIIETENDWDKNGPENQYCKLLPCTHSDYVPLCPHVKTRLNN